MCGLVGVAGFIGNKAEQAFRELLIVDTIRGPHSTGIAAVNDNGIQVVKKTLLPPDLLSLKTTGDMLDNWNSVLIGHNRWATQGVVNAINAHPFEMGSLVGAHNGTLVNQDLLPDSKDFEVDSENIFHSISKIGLAETWASLHGAASLVWYDQEDKCLHFIRNDERPMHVAFEKGSFTMFWASEAWMLEGILGKNNIEHDGIFQTKEDVHYSLNIPDFEIKGTKWYGQPFDHFDQEVLEPYKAPKKWEWSWDKKAREQRRNRNTTTQATTQKSTQTGGNDTGATSEKRNYEIGDDITFYLDLDCIINDRFILCDDADLKGEKVAVYSGQGDWLRSIASGLKEGELRMFMGTVNGFSFTHNQTASIVQSNSVAEIDSDGDIHIPFDQESDDEQYEEQLLLFKEHGKDYWHLAHQERAIIANPRCGICDCNLKPHPEHVFINETQLICEDCVGTEFAQQVMAFA